LKKLGTCDVLKVAIRNYHLAFNVNMKINKMYWFPVFVVYRWAKEFVLET